MLVYATRAFHILLSKLLKTMLDQHLSNRGMQIQIIKQHQQSVNIMPPTQIKHDVDD